MSSPLQSTLFGVFVVLAVSTLAIAEDFEANCLPKPGEDCGVYKPYSFKLSVSPMGGYNSNVILLGDGLPLPEGISRQDAGFFEIDGTATFDWKAPPVGTLVHDQVTASYEYTQDFYEGISGYDLGQHLWTAKYIHLFDKHWSYKIEANDNYSTFDGHSYSNRVLLAPALDFNAANCTKKTCAEQCPIGTLASELTTELRFSFATSDFFFAPSIPERNPDANNYGLELSETFSPKNYDVAKFKVSFVHFWNDAEGSDYDYRKNRLQFSAETRFNNCPTNRWFDLKATVKYFHDFDNYDHRNSHAGPTGFAFKRQDGKNDFGTTLSFDVYKYCDGSSKFAVNAKYHYFRDNSNVAFFNYGQHIVQAGCTLTFDDLKWR
jgi:hypothetical protein